MNEGSSWHLQCASFICGAAVMVLEMTGSRVVAPYMGTSLVVGPVGHYRGLASTTGWKSKSNPMLYLQTPILGLHYSCSCHFNGFDGLCCQSYFGFPCRFSFQQHASSVLAALAFVFILAVLAGMVSPFIVRLAMKNLGSARATVGRFSALSSAGSILGTFFGGFILISFSLREPS